MEFRKKLTQITRGQKVVIDTAKAQMKLMSLITQYPEDKLLLEALGLLYMGQGKYTQAKIFFNNIQNPPFSVLKNLGRIYFTRENYPKAIASLSKIPRAKLDAEAWELYVDALMSNNQKEKARKEAKALMQKFPESSSRISPMLK